MTMIEEFLAGFQHFGVYLEIDKPESDRQSGTWWVDIIQARQEGSPQVVAVQWQPGTDVLGVTTLTSDAGRVYGSVEEALQEVARLLSRGVLLVISRHELDQQSIELNI